MNKRGFTLIELLVVVAIIGLLSTLAVVALGSARAKSRDAKRLSDLKQIQTALELYYTDKGSYPAGDGINLGTTDYACLGTAGFKEAGCTSPYMATLPKDPNGASYYKYTVGTNTYTIAGKLEGEIEGLKGDIKLTPTGMGM